MKKNKHLLAAILVIALVFSVAPSYAHGEGETNETPSSQEGQTVDESQNLDNELDEGDYGVNPIATDEEYFDTVNGFVGTADKKTHNVFVGVGRGMNITSINGIAPTQDIINTNGMDTNIAKLYWEEPATGGEPTLKLRGVSEGKTTFQFNGKSYTLYVVPGISGFTQNKKVEQINIDSLENCISYFSINAGTLHQIMGTGYLINQTFVGAFQISFFAAPKEKGYALTKMYISGTEGQYYSMGEGSKDDCSDTQAWPLKNPEATSISDSQGWKKDLDKDGKETTKDHGYSTLLRRYMSVLQLRALYTDARAKGCDGTAQFGDYYGLSDDKPRVANITFEAEKLPTLIKSISKYKLSADKEWCNYDPQNPPDLRLGAMLMYTFTISNSGTNNVEYTDVLLSDNQIGYKMLLTYDIKNGKIFGYIGGVKKAENKKEWNIGDEINIDVEYTIKAEDIKKYSNGVFVNTATLSYKYKSRFSAGVYTESKKSTVECKINGFADYKWSGLPENADGVNCPAGGPYDMGGKFTVDSKYSQDSLVVVDGVEYKFSGWKLGDKVVTGEQVIGNQYVTFEGEWTKTGKVTLIITTKDCEDIDENQVFLFRVTGEGVDVTVAIKGNGSTKIFGLQFGETYKVTELTKWSWRYVCDKDICFEMPESGAEFSFDHTRPNMRWLDGNHIWNIFKKRDGEGA